MKFDLRWVRSGLLCTFLTLSSAACVKTDNKVDASAEPPTPPTLSSITVTPANTTVGVGGKQQYAATGTYSDGSTQDLSHTVAWSVAEPATATISNDAQTYGELTAVALGKTTVTATYTPSTATGTATAMTASTPVTVIAATLFSLTLSIDSKLGGAPANFITQLHAQGNYTDGSHADLTGSVSWLGLTPDIGTVSDAVGSKGQFKGVKAGSATVRAVQNDITQDGIVTVTNATLVNIGMTPQAANLPANTSLQMSCLGNFSDNDAIDLTEQTDWASSDTSVVTVSNLAGSKGQATGQAGLLPGTANVTATYGTVVGTSQISRPLF